MEPLREVIVFLHRDRKELYKAYFHQFAVVPGYSDDPIAIIEKFDGSVEYISANCIKFLDRNVDDYF